MPLIDFSLHSILVKSILSVFVLYRSAALPLHSILVKSILEIPRHLK